MAKKSSRPKNPSIKQKKLTIFLIIIISIFFLSQAFTIYLIYQKSDQTSKKINQTEEQLEQKIKNNEKEFQKQINAITESISSITEVQGDFQDELSEIKATTSSDFSGIIDSEVKGVVTIKTDVSQGTGFIIDEDGYIVTNYHVMEGVTAAAIYTYDTEQHRVTSIGHNKPLDISLLKIDSNNLHELDLGDSDDVKIGEKVIAIGNPFGLSFTATEGIISARDREGINDLPYYFQTDVSLNPGNSGGPLINAQGEVIGINNFKIQGAENIGFALQINQARETINNIAEENLNMTLV